MSMESMVGVVNVQELVASHAKLAGCIHRLAAEVLALPEDKFILAIHAGGDLVDAWQDAATAMLGVAKALIDASTRIQAREKSIAAKAAGSN